MFDLKEIGKENMEKISKDILDLIDAHITLIQSLKMGYSEKIFFKASMLEITKIYLIVQNIKEKENAIKIIKLMCNDSVDFINHFFEQIEEKQQ